MVATMKIRVSGLEKAAKRYNPQVVGPPLRKFFVKSTDLVHTGVTRRTRRGTTGKAKESIKKAIDASPVPRWGKVFSGLYYIRFLEFGTKPHRFPVTPAFIAWARKRKRDPYAIADAIAARGTKGKRMFRKTARGTRRKIFGFSREAVTEIAQKLRRG